MVVGVNTRPIVKSAKALGLRTVSVDCFGDVDLAAYADALFSVRPLEPRGPYKGFERPSLFELAIRALESQEVDAILLASGMEHDFKRVEELKRRAEVIGNDVSRLKLCRDKLKLFHIASKIGIPHPQTERVRKPAQALRAAERIGYPVVLKPAFGGGGMGIRLARSAEEIERKLKWVLGDGDGKTAYVQEFIRGIDASASVLSNGDEARCLTVNEQVIGDAKLGSPRPFGYCGNIIPLAAKEEQVAKIAEYSEELCSRIGLVGSNGIDFVLADEPYLMEINPRFQNTIDCVEGLLGMNLVEEHIRSCRGELGRYRKPMDYSAKLILYAKKDVKVPDLTKLPDVVDIPREGSVIKRGRPVCSILKFGKYRRRLTSDAYLAANEVYGLLKGDRGLPSR
jgi:predicted ATP-grasp superfamily ATP-dependent carboligase